MKIAPACKTALLLLMVFFSGCAPLRRHVTKTTYQRSEPYSAIRFEAARQIDIDAEQFAKLQLADELQIGRVRVRSHPQLQKQARCIAEHLDRLLTYIEDVSNLRIIYDTVTVYLMRFDNQPENFRVEAPLGRDDFPVVLFTAPGQSCHEIVSSNIIFPYAVIHEITELSMTDGQDVIALLDVSWNWLLFRTTVANHTRWFRDGLANYLGYLAHRYTYEQLPAGPCWVASATAVHQHPFTSLARVRTDVLRWTRTDQQQLTADYYNAALGIFLLIEHKYGSQAIADIVEAAYELDYPDGKALAGVINRVIDDDLVKMIEDFRFPYTGLKLQSLSPASAMNHGYGRHSGLLVSGVAPDSAASAAGIAKNSVITRVNGREVATILQFQQQLLAAGDDRAVTLTILKSPESAEQAVSLEIRSDQPPPRPSRPKGSAQRSITLSPVP